MSREERKARKAEKKAAKKAEKERLLRLKMTPRAMLLYAVLNIAAFAYLNEGFIKKDELFKQKKKSEES